MIVLDTNVVSERLRPIPDRGVVSWLAAHDDAPLYLSAPGLAELLTGVAVMPEGRRKDRLAELLDMVRADFGRSVLPFDDLAAAAYADIMARSRRAGLAIGMGDGQIAAIALSRGASVATRDTAPFAAAGVPVINPWLAA